MKKKLIIVLGSIALLAFAATTAFGTITNAKQQEVNNLQKQMFELRKQMVQKYVEAGKITPAQGKLAQERIDQGYKNVKANGGTGFGACGGSGICGGPGSCGGRGQGLGFGAGSNNNL